jgi:hypothetical protein
VKLGTENKKKLMWLAILGPIALLIFAYQIIPMFMDSPAASSSSAEAAAPLPATRTPARALAGKGKRVYGENLDPTLKLDLLASSEKTIYEGNGRNIFVSHAEDIPQPKGPAVTDTPTEQAYVTPPPPQPPPIPLKFFGFASKPGEAKRVFLQQNEDIFVAGEGEIVNRRYKVVRIAPTSVEIQDMVGSGPPQNIPLTPG